MRAREVDTRESRRNPCVDEIAIDGTVQQTKGTEREHEMHDAPDPIVPKNIFSQSLTIGEVPAEELARQLTLIDQDLYASLTVRRNENESAVRLHHRLVLTRCACASDVDG